MNILAFGEILWDIIEGEHHLGGAPFNFAAHVVKCGGRASVLSAVGNDELGSRALSRARDLGVDVSMVASVALPTGTVDVFLKDGQPDYTIHEGVAFDRIPPPAPEAVKSGKFDVFYFGTLAQRDAVSRATLQGLLEQNSFDYVFYDINLRKEFYSREIISTSLRAANILKINDHEAEKVSALFYDTILPLEECCRRLAVDFGLLIIIITAAEKGCYVWLEGALHHVPGRKVMVADAVGAGDSF
ncbi:MAG: PfkB family carbohydrate kinase, partial [Bacteroidota bacterium]